MRKGIVSLKLLKIHLPTYTESKVIVNRYSNIKVPLSVMGMGISSKLVDKSAKFFF